MNCNRPASRFFRSSGPEPGLEERHLTAGGLGYLSRVGIEPNDLVSKVCHAYGVGETEVSDAYDR